MSEENEQENENEVRAELDVAAARVLAEMYPTAMSFRDWLIREAEETSAMRTFKAYANQLERMLTADDLDAIIDSDERGTHETRDLVGVHLDILPGMDVAKSAERFAAPLGVYVQFPARARSDYKRLGIKQGDDLLVSSGAPLIIGKVRTLNAGEYLPLPMMIAGTDTASGTLLKLQRVPGVKYAPGS